MFHFLGIGAQKAGTTWLYEMMRLHPSIHFPAGKEVHFWDRPFTVADKTQYLSQFLASDQRCGEITPAYAMLDEATIAELRDLAPGLRIIFIIRHPIDRAWSSALMALEHAEMTLEEASDQWFIDHFHSFGSLARGDYLRTIINWRRAFGVYAVLIRFHEELQRDPRVLLAAVANHLDIALEPFLRIPEPVLKKAVYPGPAAPIRPSLRPIPIRPSLRPILESLYRRRIEELEDYLGQRLSW